jgi:phenylacetate-coenzyme A ligase PaaK-like adenylate-forming protein
MQNARFFKDKLFKINAQNFEAFALSLFQWQAVHNPIYHAYLAHLGKKPGQVHQLSEIPFLPIRFFKDQRVVTEDTENTASDWTYFESSGTTGQQPSRHYVNDTAFYLQVCRSIFEQQYGQLQDFHIFALLPSYLERQHASLVAMTDYFIRESQSPLSGFYLQDYEQLIGQLDTAKKSKRQILLLGVSFALLELAEHYQPDLQGVTVMETGGMKGRRKELVREELHQILQRGLNVSQIHSEYGMTELMSQAYAHKQGLFRCPPWMQVFIRDINDPFYMDRNLRYGGINIIDLANVHSCAFLETQDLGKYHSLENTFEVLGRFDNSDTRGCNLMVSF